jgi:hypothetical protein
VAQKALDKYKNDYDVVLGSVHTISYKNTYVPYSQIDFSGFSADDVQEFLKIYFDDVLIRKDGLFVLDELKPLNPENLLSEED